MVVKPGCILAFDSGMGGCSAGVLDPEADYAVAEIESMARGQAEKLVPMINFVLDKAAKTFSDIGLIATTTGPGAFTGLRIGLSTARALGLALGCPVIGLTTTECLAAAYFEKNKKAGKDILVLIETKRDDFYGQTFAPDGQASSEPFALPSSDIARLYAGKNTLIIGDAHERFLKDTGLSIPFQDGYALPDPAVMARLAHSYRDEGAKRKPQPLYLRDADVSSSKKARRVIEE